MSNIEVIKDLHDRGCLKPLITGGIVPAKVLMHMEMYYAVDARVKSGQKRGIAVCMTAATFGVTPRSVQRAIRGLK